MARGEHRPSCARIWRQRAEAESWSLWQTAQAIQSCCGVSLLKAHRLAQGWTARVAIEQLAELCEREHLDPPHANIDLLNAWENGRGRPRHDTIDLLARLYQGNAIRLGLAADYSEQIPDQHVVVRPPAQAAPRLTAPVLRPDDIRPLEAVSHEDDQRSTVFYEVLAGAGQSLGGLVLAEAEKLRWRMDRTLASSTVTEDQLDRLDETILRYRREYITTAPLPMLCQLMLEFDDVRKLAANRQPGPVQRRLSRAVALLAVLSADALMKLGDIRQARSWYGTARKAADDTADPHLRALVRAQEPMLPYYYGDLPETVRLACEAQALARSAPCSPTALAAAAEGRALARMGDLDGAGRALAQAQRLFARIKANTSIPMAFGFTEERLYLYLSGAHAHMPDAKQAEKVQLRALALCRGLPGIDPVLISLDRATSLARTGGELDACKLAESTLAALAPEHRTSIVFVRAP